MATRKKKDRTPGNTIVSECPPRRAPARHLWIASAAAFGALLAALFIYAPSLHGPFLFDDIGLPFYPLNAADQPFRAWVSGVRPLLMLSYWVNLHFSGRDPSTYHLVNVLLHVASSLLVYLLISRILRLQQMDARRSMWCSGVAACIFLVHPLQTEAVAYIAGRSEVLCGLFSIAALAVFSDPARFEIRWKNAAVILLLYVAAVLSKEQAAVLPVSFLFIDIYFRGLSFREALRRGRSLYIPIAVVSVLAVGAVFLLLSRSTTAGFNIIGMHWYEYLFTQFRVWLVYLYLAVLPFGQNADYDLPLSRTVLDHGSMVALAVLLATALIAWRFRKTYPLLFGGLMMFAILLAPTSSVIPVQDLAAERRMYLPLVGLLLVLVQVLSRIKTTEIVTTAVFGTIILLAALTHERAKLWSSDIAFWSDVVTRSPLKMRGYTHLAYAYARERQCADAISTVESVPAQLRKSADILEILGRAYACEKRMDDAVAAFERAVNVGPAVGRYLALASMYRRVGRQSDAQVAEHHATLIRPRTSYDFSMLEAWRRRQEVQSRSRSLYVPGGINR